MKKNVVNVCPLAAKVKRNVLCGTKYPLKILVADDNKMILQVLFISLYFLYTHSFLGNEKEFGNAGI